MRQGRCFTNLPVVLLFLAAVTVLTHIPVAIGAWQLRRGTLRHPGRWRVGFNISDYAFLALTCTALITTAADVDRWWKQQELQHELRSNDDYTDSLDATAALARSRHEEWWDACLNAQIEAANAWTDGRKRAEDNQLLPARRRFQEAAELYRGFISTYGGRQLEEGKEPEDRAVWMSRTETHLGEVETLVSLIDDTSKGSLERLLFLIGPYTVAAGLAIRFAKVSAGLVGLC